MRKNEINRKVSSVLNNNFVQNYLAIRPARGHNPAIPKFGIDFSPSTEYKEIMEKVRKYSSPKMYSRESSECDCEDCQEMCSIPCACSPRGAAKLLELGFGDCLERDYYEERIDGVWKTFYLLQVKHEGWFTRCPMQDKETGKCKLHGPWKPLEAKLATCGGHSAPSWVKHTLRMNLCAFWDSDEGRKLLALYE